jgi:hypothetical protein
LTLIGGGAFANTELTSITLNEGLTLIGSYAFAGTRLTNIILPDSLSGIGNAFRCCAPNWDLAFTHGYSRSLPFDIGNSLLPGLSDAEIDDYFRSLPVCCDNATLVSVTYQGVTYYAERANRSYYYREHENRSYYLEANSFPWDLPREFYDSFIDGWY